MFFCSYKKDLKPIKGDGLFMGTGKNIILGESRILAREFDFNVLSRENNLVVLERLSDKRLAMLLSDKEYELNSRVTLEMYTCDGEEWFFDEEQAAKDLKSYRIIRDRYF